MKKSKKASLYNSLQGLIIFAILLVAVISFTRSFTQEKKIDHQETIQEIDKTIKELIELQEGTSKKMNLELAMDSAIIAYAPNKEAIILNQDLNIPKLALGLTNSEFKGTLPDNLENYKLFLNARYDYESKYASQGFIKQKPSTCPTNKGCVCYCEQITLITTPNSIYNWENAYLACQKENCLVLEDNKKIKEKTFLKTFFEQVDPYYRKIKDENGNIINIQTTPDIDTIHWDGGFIIMRSSFGLSTTCSPMKRDGVSTTHTCEKVFSGIIRSDYETVFLSPTIAGYRKDFPLRFIDVEFKNEQGQLSAKLI